MYEDMLHEFDEALLREDWPMGDKAIPFKAINILRLLPAQVELDIEVSGSMLITTGSKRQANDELSVTMGRITFT